MASFKCPINQPQAHCLTCFFKNHDTDECEHGKVKQSLESYASQIDARELAGNNDSLVKDL
jgi:hypothetical protein